MLNMLAAKLRGTPEKSESDDAAGEAQSDEEYTDKLLERLVDQNLAFHCLKIIVLCLGAFNKGKRM